MGKTTTGIHERIHNVPLYFLVLSLFKCSIFPESLDRDVKFVSFSFLIPLILETAHKC
jgi:hypothetical protein